MSSTMTGEIIKGMEVPPRKQGRYQKYPWDRMEVGDAVQVTTRSKASKYTSMARAFCARRGMTGRTFRSCHINGKHYVVRVNGGPVVGIYRGFYQVLTSMEGQRAHNAAAKLFVKRVNEAYHEFLQSITRPSTAPGERTEQ